MADWSSIPSELVGLIANKLSAIEDYRALTGVCRSYRSATKVEDWRPEEVSRPPWLLLSCQDDDDDGSVGENPPTSERGLLSMYYDGTKFLMNLPELQGRRCWGTPYGWIVTLGLDMKFHLFNPLNRRRIALPDLAASIHLYHDYVVDVRIDVINKPILIKRPPHSSSSSGSDDFLVVTIGRSQELRVMRHGRWEEAEFLWASGFVFDLVCYKGQIYALGYLASLSICSNFVDGPDPPTVHEFVQYDLQFFGGWERYYAVESLGELLLVVRYLNYAYGEGGKYTYEFKVCKLDFATRKWVKLDDLGDCALFVGDCQSTSLCQPEDFNCRRNCIYFTDDYYAQFNDGIKGRGGGKDMGIFDYKTLRIEPLYEGDGYFSPYSPPTWFIPTLT